MPFIHVWHLPDLAGLSGLLARRSLECEFNPINFGSIDQIYPVLASVKSLLDVIRNTDLEEIVHVLEVCKQIG